MRALELIWICPCRLRPCFTDLDEQYEILESDDDDEDFDDDDGFDEHLDDPFDDLPRTIHDRFLEFVD